VPLCRTHTRACHLLPVTRMWWRVRALNGSGEPGSWSPGRRFEVKT
jgi:hypothetical protein